MQNRKLKSAENVNRKIRKFYIHDIFEIEIFLTLQCLKIDCTSFKLGLWAKLACFAAQTPRDEVLQLRQNIMPWTPY